MIEVGGFNPLEYKSMSLINVSNSSGNTYSGKGICILQDLKESGRYNGNLTVDGARIASNLIDKAFPITFFFKSSFQITGDAYGVVYYY